MVNKCGKCNGCLNAADGLTCDKCRYCLDSARRGGKRKLKQACEYKWCINKTKKEVDVARLPKNKGSHQSTMTKKKTVMVTNSMNKAGDGVVAKMRKAVKKSKGVKEINGAKETNGGKLVLTKVARGSKMTEVKTDSMNKDKAVRSSNVMEKAKSNVHPWQRRTIGGSFSGDTLLEYGGEELGPKSGRVAWKDPDDIKQEEETTEAREDQLQPAKERGVKRKMLTRLASAQDCTNEVSEEENRVGHGAASLRSVEESAAVVSNIELPNFQIDQATSLIQEECSSIEGGEGEEVVMSMDQEPSNESSPKLVNDTGSQSEEDGVMEVSVTVQEDDGKEEVKVEWEEISVQKVLESAKRSICERKERIIRVRAEKEIEGVRLAELKSEEEDDIKRLEEIDRIKIRNEREQLEIRRKVRERDLMIHQTKQLYKEKEKQEARLEEELQNDLRALKELAEGV